MMRGIAVCCVAFGVGGCSLLLSTSDLHEQGAALPDAGTTPAIDASEAGADASSAGDATTTTDGAPISRFCETLSPPAKHCSDFDGPGDAVKAGWDEVAIDPASVGSVTLDAMGRAGSSALINIQANPSCAYTRLTKSFPTSGKGARYSFSFRPSAPWLTDAIFSVFELENEVGDCGILFHVQRLPGSTKTFATLHFQYAAQDDIHEWSAGPTLDVWSKIETTIAADGSSISVSIDGTVVVTKPIPNGCAFGSAVFVAPGFHCESDAHEARYDDIVVDYP